MSRLKVAAAFAAFAALAPMAHAELINNGGFESPVNAFSGGFQTYSSGLAGWTIDYGSVDLINNYWMPASGSFSLDLNGNSAASISQSFATQVGQTYVVSFSMAGNPDGGGTKTIDVNVNGPHSYSFGVGGSSGNMGWVNHSFSFVASSAISTLSFIGDPLTGPYGAALDNISVVEAVPEPETYGMMLAGLSLLGWMARRRRN
jgi:choice-of-anchor C domain-containing protein